MQDVEGREGGGLDRGGVKEMLKEETHLGGRQCHIRTCLVRPSSAYLGSRVWGVPCTECRCSLAWEKECRDYGRAIPVDCLEI